MKKRIIVSILIVLSIIVYLVGITTAPLDSTISFCEMSWDETKIYISFIIFLSAITFGSIPWVLPYLRKNLFH
jgi:hypothetical protein